MNEELRHALALVLRLLETDHKPPASEPEPNRAWTMNHEVENCNKEWTVLQYDAAMALKNAGWSNARIGELLGRSTRSIDNLAKVGRRLYGEQQL